MIKMTLHCLLRRCYSKNTFRVDSKIIVKCLDTVSFLFYSDSDKCSSNDTG